MMQPRLPSVWYAKGRETAFFHIPEGASTKAVFPKLFDAVATRRAKDGAVVDNGCFLTSPDGRTFQAITWHGGRLGQWRRDFIESTQAQGIITARFRARRFVTSDGKRYWFRDLLVEQR